MRSTQTDLALDHAGHFRQPGLLQRLGEGSQTAYAPCRPALPLPGGARRQQQQPRIVTAVAAPERLAPTDRAAPSGNGAVRMRSLDSHSWREEAQPVHQNGRTANGAQLNGTQPRPARPSAVAVQPTPVQTTPVLPVDAEAGMHSNWHSRAQAASHKGAKACS